MEDVRDIENECERMERLSNKECCVYLFYDTAEELVGGMLHRHVVQIGGC